MSDIKLGPLTFNHEGITLIVGNFREYFKNVDTTDIKTDVDIIFCPEATMYERNMVDFVANKISDYKTLGKEFLVITDSNVFIRAVECLTDLNGVMEKLNVYDIQCDNGVFSVKNLMYSEYGISSFYDAVGTALNDLDARLESKYLS